VGTDPVSETLATRGSATSAAPTSPAPWMTLNTPGGAPASTRISASFKALSGVSSEGLKIIALPQASAGAAFQQAIWIG
jgi:hypothetical protein